MHRATEHSADSTMARSRLPSCNATRRPLVARFATTPVTVSSVARQWACGTPHDWYRSHDGDDGGDGGGGEGINETLEYTRVWPALSPPASIERVQDWRVLVARPGVGATVAPTRTKLAGLTYGVHPWSCSETTLNPLHGLRRCHAHPLPAGCRLRSA